MKAGEVAVRVITSPAGGVLLLAGAAYIAWRYFKPSFDPTGQENLANRGANAIVQAVRGDPNVTVGTSIFDAVEAVRDLFGAGVERTDYTAGSRAGAVNNALPGLPGTGP